MEQHFHPGGKRITISAMRLVSAVLFVGLFLAAFAFAGDDWHEGIDPTATVE